MPNSTNVPKRPKPVRPNGSRRVKEAIPNDPGAKKRRARALTANRRHNFIQSIAIKPRPPPVRRPRKTTQNETGAKKRSALALTANHRSAFMQSIAMKPRPPPVRRPKKVTLKSIQKQSSNIATNVVQQALKTLKSMTPSLPKPRKPRPPPVRRPKKASQKTLKSIQKQSSSMANSVVQETLNALKTIKNYSANPIHQYGLLGPRNSPEPNLPKPRRSKPRSKPRSKSRSVSLNNAGPAREPERTLSLNQVAFPSFNVKEEMRKAQSQSNFFKTAIQRRKAASKARSAKGKAI